MRGVSDQAGQPHKRLPGTPRTLRGLWGLIMKRIARLAVIMVVALGGVTRVSAQTPQPNCDQYAPQSVDYYKCMGLVETEPESTLAEQQSMMTVAAIGAIVVVGVLVGGSMMLSRRRLRNVPANEVRDILRALVPPEAGTITDDMLDGAVRQLTSAPVDQQVVVVVVFVGFVAVAGSYLLTGFGTLTVILIAVLLLVVLGLAIRAVLLLAWARRTSTGWLQALGLSIVDVPSIGMVGAAGGGLMTRTYGATTMGGMRYGRHVTVSFAASGMNSQRVITHVAAPVGTAFEVKGSDSKWQSRGLPQGVVDALSGVGPLDRQIRITGGADGIRIQRDRNTVEATSAKGTVNWFKDIQLAEKLADALRPK